MSNESPQANKSKRKTPKKKDDSSNISVQRLQLKDSEGTQKRSTNRVFSGNDLSPRKSEHSPRKSSSHNKQGNTKAFFPDDDPSSSNLNNSASKLKNKTKSSPIARKKSGSNTKINSNQKHHKSKSKINNGTSKTAATNVITGKPDIGSRKPRPPAKKSTLEKIVNFLGFSVRPVALHDDRAIDAVNALQLTPSHLKKLKAKFDKIDVDGSGNISSDEFFEALGEQRSPFTDKLFALIDLDGSGTIEFDEYVCVLATYCMFTKEEILRFCFACFDTDESGSIDEHEFIELCKSVNNASPAFPSNFAKALEEFDTNEDGLIDYEEFLELDRRFPLILFPAFRLQDYMQKNTLGEGQWLKIIEKRAEQKRIEEYMVAHNGRLPPQPFSKKMLKCLLPCIYSTREFVPLKHEHKRRVEKVEEDDSDDD